MKIETKKTRQKGIIVKYVFDDEKDYNDFMADLNIISKHVDDQKGMNEVISLFKDYYHASDPYSDNKPTVIVYQDHLLTLAIILWLMEDLYVNLTDSLIVSTKRYIELQNKMVELQRKVINGNT